MAVSSSHLERHERVDLDALTATVRERFGQTISPTAAGRGYVLNLQLNDAESLPALCRFLFWDRGCSFGGIIAEEHTDEWRLQYPFLLSGVGWLAVTLRFPSDATTVPSISAEVHAADWHEREIEDLFGITFEGHPRLGDFILHDQVWHEGIAPMRKRFAAIQPHFERQPDLDWRPLLVVQDPGSFAMPVGPVYEGGIGEPQHFLLETVGEDVIRSSPRLFYKYRAVEKIAEGKTISDVLLLAERFAATSAFAHSLAFCQAVERIQPVTVPERAETLRVVLCELERLRHHAGAIAAICESTALAVSAAHAAIIEEELLRASCVFAGHRYLFGVNLPGGLSRDFDMQACTGLLLAADKAITNLLELEERLRYSSSFLDRLEDVGAIDGDAARDLNLVGPIGRASAQMGDLRRACPYSGYERYTFEIPCENEGDGYARLRVLFFEAIQSAKLIHQAIDSLQAGPVNVPCDAHHSGAALGWVEAPRGAALHWISIDGAGLVNRYHAITPSFNNWLGFHLAAENFAFQDFPIILATFGLSATECDR
ncbi:MAG: NADH-quinone oxidoreductase subunit C [Candidatus Korobacteraceae bacterium]